MSTTDTYSERLVLKQNDAYAVPWTLTDREGEPIDLADANEVRFVMADAVNGTLYVNQPADIVSPSKGRVSYTFSTQETGEADLFVAEWHVLYPDGRQRTLPTEEPIGVDIRQGIARTLQAADLDPDNAVVAMLDAQTTDTDTAFVRNAPTQPDHPLRQGDIGTAAFAHAHNDDDLQPATVGGHYWAFPGELQVVLDAASAAADAAMGERTVVHMDPSQVYNVGAELRVPKGVTLACWNAPIRVTADHDGVFVDSRAHLLKANIIVDVANYTGTAVSFDTSKVTGPTKYGATGHSASTITGEVRNDQGPSGTGFGVYVTDATGNNAVGIGTRVDLAVTNFRNGWHVDSGGTTGWTNAGHWYLELTNNIQSFRQTGGGPVQTRVKGIMQTASHTTHHFNNVDGGGSIDFEGKIWDWPRTKDAGGSQSTTFLAGDNMVIVADQLSGLVDQVAPDSNSMGYEYHSRQGKTMYDFSKQQGYRQTPTADGMQFDLVPGGANFTLLDNGAFTMTRQNLNNIVPDGIGEIRLHSGAGTGGNPELAVADANGNWRTTHSDSIVDPTP